MKQWENKLIDAAISARKNAKAKYSNFKVGAALLDEEGNIFTGCNVESSSYGLTICAERVALTKALSEGAQKFKTIAIVTDSEELTPPCGACRQLLYDYAPDLEIIIANLKGKSKRVHLKEVFPEPFGDKFLE